MMMKTSRCRDLPRPHQRVNSSADIQDTTAQAHKIPDSRPRQPRSHARAARTHLLYVHCVTPGPRLSPGHKTPSMNPRALPAKAAPEHPPSNPIRVWKPGRRNRSRRRISPAEPLSAKPSQLDSSTLSQCRCNTPASYYPADTPPSSHEPLQTTPPPTSPSTA